MIHIRNASTTDVLSDESSTRTTVFSKRASITTKSSQSSLSVKSSKCSQLIVALDLSTGKSTHRDDGSAKTFEPRTFSLSNARMSSNSTSKMQEDMESARSSTITRDDELLEFGTAYVLSTTTANLQPVHRTEFTVARQKYNNTISSSEYGRGNSDFVSAPSVAESHGTEHMEGITGDHPYGDNTMPLTRRRWYYKLSRTMAEVPGKAQELAKAAKKFGLTLRAFVR